MKKILFIITMATALTACNNSNTKNISETTSDEKPVEVISESKDLLDKEWKLTELNGKTVVLDTASQKYPHLIFHKENTISGNLGCNSFGGNIKFESGNTIKMSDITATQMACPNMEVEQRFLDALNNAKRYTEQNNILTLSNDKKEITAKLEVLSK